MDNLALQQSNKVPCLGQVQPNSLSIDWDLRVAFFVASNHIYSLDLRSDQVSLVHESLFNEAVNSGDIVCTNFLLEEKLYFILLTNGKIITYDSLNKELFEHSIEVPTSVDDAKFSHDQELFAVTTRDNQMLLFNKIMILQTAYDMNKTDYGTNELVNVNWGSKSTQFHGEGMRDKRIVKEEYYALNAWDDVKSCIDWRGDDNHFVVNLVGSEGFRKLKLFNRQGILQHTSEYVAGLEKHVAWKPSGALIAASQTLPNKHSIIFFEKNGLKHGEFDLPYSPKSFMITKLAWSHDSDILLVCGTQIAPTEDSFQTIRQSIMLYTQSNYYWYQKQKFDLNSPHFVQDILWDEQQFSLLHSVSSDATYCSHNYRKILNTTSSGKVMVVDGSRVNISHLDRTLVPPPMFTYAVCFEEQVLQLCHSHNLLAVYLNGNHLIILKSVAASIAECANLNYPVSYNFENVFADFSNVYLPVFSKKIERISEMVLPVLLEDGRIFGIIDKNIVCFDYTNGSKEIDFLAPIDKSISALVIKSSGQLLLASESGQLHTYDIEANSCEVHGDSLRYDDSPSRLLVHTDLDGVAHAVVLTGRGSLYYDQSLILSSMVNSVHLCDNKYLLFATSDSLFYCWPLLNFDAYTLNQSNPPRSLERGAKIVATCSSEAKVVLQMPRGNLEAFYPRALLLDKVQLCLERLNFVGAFEILRKNRINLNYICDYNLDLFTKNCGIFVEQIGQCHVDWICLFLSELCSENVLPTLNRQAEVRVENKLDTICELLLSTMLEKDRIKFINPILLTYIKRQRPQIEKALEMVKNLPNNKLRDEAIKFLLYVVKANRLFDEALGTYDFDVLLMVASKSNKDPKEYLSMVNAFKAIENEHYRRYKIDIQLQRYERALVHLSKCDDKFDEALQLIEEKHLFREAIEIYNLNSSPLVSSKYRQIWDLYGQYLFKKKYYREAAIAFKRADNYSQAFKMYLMHSNWNMASVCARRLSGANQEDFAKLIHSVSQQLILNGNWIDGSFILEHYLHDYKEAFCTLVKGHEWDRAIRCFNDHQLEQTLFDTELRAELLNAFEAISESIDRIAHQLKEHLSRLQEVKESRTSNQPAMNGRLEADFDSYSDTSSVFDTASIKSSDSGGSVSSLKTNRTNSRAKQQKRLAQKKYMLKKGSANEDINLVHAIKELISESRRPVYCSESAALVTTLYDLFFIEQSRTLQQKLKSLRSQMAHAVDFIWNSDYFQQRLAEDETLRTAPSAADETDKWELVLD